MFLDTKRAIKRKIGQLLLERGLITKDILSEAICFQKMYGGFLGGYLVKHGYVTEEDIVKCLAGQYGFPFIDLSNFKIEQEVANIIPVSIAEKYCLIPIDRLGGVITIAVANPLNEDAIKAVRLITGCEVQVFITTISGINAALEEYYGIRVSEDVITDIRPKFIHAKGYSGKDRRRFFRFKANIDIHFAYQDKYIKEHTKDISGGGICFYLKNQIPINSYLTLEIALPSEVMYRPIASVIKVVRVRESEDKKRYEIGAMFVQLDPLDRTAIIKYAKRVQSNNY